jgi:hypothetical protein
MLSSELIVDVMDAEYPPCRRLGSNASSRIRLRAAGTAVIYIIKMLGSWSTSIELG